MGHAYDPGFSSPEQSDLVALIRANPLAWLVTDGRPDSLHSPLPLRVGLDADGQLRHLHGHLALRNPQLQQLRENPAAVALFMGPQSYVSPSWLDDRTQAPTWNYCSATLRLEVEVLDTPADIEAELDALAQQMEAGRPRAWRVQDMGERFARLSQGVVAIRGKVLAAHATFKLGQDERPGDYTQIVQGLETQGEHALLDWMKRFNARIGR